MATQGAVVPADTYIFCINFYRAEYAYFVLAHPQEFAHITQK